MCKIHQLCLVRSVDNRNRQEISLRIASGSHKNANAQNECAAILVTLSQLNNQPCSRLNRERNSIYSTVWGCVNSDESDGKSFSFERCEKF